MHSGPEVSGCKPVLVTFEEYRDRDEVLRKANMLKGSGLSVTEDMSRRVREARTELRKFMRELKKTNPAATCHIQYDKLFVNHRCYVWSESQAKVVEFSQADQSRSEWSTALARHSDGGRRIMVLLRQFSYAIKTQIKAPKAPC